MVTRPSLVLIILLTSKLYVFSNSLTSAVVRHPVPFHHYRNKCWSTKATRLEMNTTYSIQSVIDFIQLTVQLKQTLRTGWVLRGVPHAESVADHSWHVALLALFILRSSNQPTLEDFSNPPLDVIKCAQMALIHDLAECIVGDITPCDRRTKDEKQKLEHDAIDYIASFLDKIQGNSSPKEKLLELFHEYEKRDTPEAIAVKDLDLLDLIVQADLYEKLHEKNNFSLEEFFSNTPPDRFKTDVVKRYAEEVHQRRKSRWDDKRGNCENNVVPSSIMENWQDSVALSREDEDFVAEYAATATDIKLEDIRSVVQSLRAKDRVLGRDIQM